MFSFCIPCQAALLLCRWALHQNLHPAENQFCKELPCRKLERRCSLSNAQADMVP